MLLQFLIDRMTEEGVNVVGNKTQNNLKGLKI